MSVSGQTTRKIDWMKASFHRIFFFPYFYLCHLHQLYESPLFVVEAYWSKNWKIVPCIRSFVLLTQSINFTFFEKKLEQNWCLEVIYGNSHFALSFQCLTHSVQCKWAKHFCRVHLRRWLVINFLNGRKMELWKTLVLSQHYGYII